MEQSINKNTFSWTEKNMKKLGHVMNTLEELKEFQPLTLRQIFYQLVAKNIIPNTVSQYTMLSKLIKFARIDGLIPWDGLEDRVRTYHDLSGWLNQQNFVLDDLNCFLTGYQRNLLQSQSKKIEIFVEKDALSRLFTKAATEYTVPVSVCRGFSSVSFLHGYKQRVLRNSNKKNVLLYFGDFDPSGICMLESMKKTLEIDFNLSGITYKRIALVKEDIEKFQLPHDPSALKTSDTRAAAHVKKYGELAVELDALRPDILISKIKNAIEDEIDKSKFLEEVEKYHDEMRGVENLRSEIYYYCHEWCDSQ